MININDIQPWTPPVPLLDKRGVHNYMGGTMTYGLLRHLAEETGGPYLEIGSYRGVSLLAAGMGTGIKCTGIDNFSGISERLADQHEKALRANIAGHANIRLLQKDFRQDRSKKKYGVIFVDGPHDAAGTLAQLEFSADRLKDGGYIVVDDTNWPAVSDTARAFFDGKDFKLVLNITTGRRDDPKWWNGIQVWKAQ